MPFLFCKAVDCYSRDRLETRENRRFCVASSATPGGAGENPLNYTLRNDTLQNYTLQNYTLQKIIHYRMDIDLKAVYREEKRAQGNE